MLMKRFLPALLALLFCVGMTASAQTVIPATVNFSTTNSGLLLNPAFCGLSYEKSKLTGSLFVSTNTALIKMFGQIAPAVLRIGGNSVDTTCWGGVSNLTAITPAQVTAFAGFVKGLPTNWHVLYGVNMSVNDPTNVAAEASYVATALGSKLLGFEIGNECDLYRGNGIRPTNYTYAQFLPQWRALSAAITNAVPGWAITNGGNGWVLTGPADGSDSGDYGIPFAHDEAGIISPGSNVNFTAYGVRHADGGMGAVLINKETNETVHVTVDLGSNVTAVSALKLTGPNLDSTNGHTIGGAPINANGSWAGGVQFVNAATNGLLTIEVLPISAVWLDPATIPFVNVSRSSTNRDTVVLGWTNAAFSLQSSPWIDGVFTDVTNASPFVVSTTNLQNFIGCGLFLAIKPLADGRASCPPPWAGRSFHPDYSATSSKDGFLCLR
jgi:hypothetical protein